MRAQYLAYWLNGDGTENLMDPDLPLQDVKVTRERNGLGRLTASLPPEYGKLTAFANRPVIQDWATAIYVELDGDMFDGFLVAESASDDTKLTIDAVGFVGYADNQPWSDRTHSYNQGNVLLSNPILSLWNEVQRLNGADIGLKLDLAGSWPRVGNPVWDLIPNPKHPGAQPKKPSAKQPKSPKYPSRPTSGSATAKKKEWAKRLKQYEADRKKYDADMKAWRAGNEAYNKAKRAWDEKFRKYEQDKKSRDKAIEDAKIKFNYWSTTDILSSFQSLASEFEFSYRVDHSRRGNDVSHTLRVRPGRLGVRRHGITFIEGENVYTVPTVTNAGEERVTSAVVLGSGDGSKMKWSQTSNPAGGSRGLRRARVFADKTLTRNSQLAARAKEMLARYNDPIEIDQFTVVDHGLAPIRTFDVGDEIFMQTFSRRAGDFERWVTVEEISVQPDKGVVQVKVAPVS